MVIPIVLFHKSEKYYVSCALRAARNHGNDVTIITDVNPKIYSDYANVVDFNNYKSEAAAQFEKVYQHFSTNPHVFEFTAIEKYFFLLKYMKKHQLKKMLYIDSDLLLYGNVTEIIDKHYSSYDVCSCISEQKYEDFYWTASGHLSLWTYQALEDFCDFIIKVYTEKDQIENLKRKWQFHVDNNMSGGICDMTLVYLFLRETKLKTGNFLSVVEDTFSFDNAMKGSIGEFQDEYKMEYSFLLGDIVKEIKFKNGYPYAYNKIRQNDILLYCLHCQAEAKRLMPMLVKGKKTFQESWLDNSETIKFFYGALKRDISRKILRRKL